MEQLQAARQLRPVHEPAARGAIEPSGAIQLHATGQLLNRSPRIGALHGLAGAINAGATIQRAAVLPLRTISQGAGVVQAAFKQVGTTTWVDGKGNRYRQVEARVDDRVKIQGENGEPFTINRVNGVWNRQAKHRQGLFFRGEKGTVLTKDPSFDSDDSEGEEYHVPGEKQHSTLAKRTHESERKSKTQNLVAASMSVVFRRANGETAQVTSQIQSMWNSGYFQHLLEGEGEPVSFETGQREIQSRVLPEKNFSAQLHAHSEVSMNADPKVVQELLQLFTTLASKAGKGGVILKVLIRVHSSPNTVCMNACRSALEEVREKVAGLLKVTPEGIRASGRFAVELMVTSDKPFQKLAGNKAHAKLAKGEGGEDLPPRLSGGRVIEVLNEEDRKKQKDK